jgi:hypothetical protein
MSIREARNVHHNDDVQVFANVRNIELKNVLGILDKEGPLVFQGSGFDRSIENVQLVKVKKFDREFLVLKLLDSVEKCVEVVSYVVDLGH